MSKVFIVIDPELGWDNVIGVFSGTKYTKAELQEAFKDQGNIIVKSRDVETDLDAYLED